MSNPQPTCNIGEVRFGLGEKFTAYQADLPSTLIVTVEGSEADVALYLKTEITEGDTSVYTGWLTPPRPDYCFTADSVTSEFGVMRLYPSGRFTFALNNQSDAVTALSQGESRSADLSVTLGQALDYDQIVTQRLHLKVTIHGIDNPPVAHPRTQPGDDDDGSAEIFAQEPSYYQTLLPQLEAATVVA